MFKRIKLNTFTKVLIAFALTFATIFSFCAFSIPTAQAATLSNLPISGISASYDNDKWEVSGSSIIGTATASSSTSCGSTTYTAKTTTLTFTNTSGATGDFSFDYTLALNSGSVKIDGASKTANGSFTKSGWAANGTMTIALTSPKSSTAAKITLSSLSFEAAESTVTTNFKAAEHGYYTVTNQTGDFSAEIHPGDATVTQTQSSKNLYTFTVYPDTGYEFVTWKVNNVSATVTNPYEQTNNNATMYPFFKLKGSASFSVGSNVYYDLNEANSAASSASSKVIVLNETGTVSAGNYTIASGVTLLLPRTATETTVPFTTTPTTVTETTAVSMFRKLTLLSGVTITVRGSICIPSSVCRSNGSNRTASPTGPSSILHLNDGATIDFESNANFYCWGFTTGLGWVHMKSGSKVYELFQLPCWKGGTVMSNINSQTKTNRVFPLNAYFIQNCEAHLRVDYGATETIFFTTTMSIMTYDKSVEFISQSKGMFHLTSGYLVKFYDSTKDRLIVDVYGDVQVSSFSITMTITIETKNYILPITNNMTINIHSGTTTLASGQDLSLMPSAELNVLEGGTFQINSGSSLYVHTYNSATWGNYTSNSATFMKMSCVMYTPTGGTAAKDSTNNCYYLPNRPYSSMKNGVINVAGTLVVNGSLYSTLATRNEPDNPANGGVISTSGRGSIQFAASSLGSATSMYELTGDTTFDTIPVQPITMINGSLYDGDRVVHSVAQKEFVYTLDADHPDDYDYGTWDPRSIGQIDVVMSFGYVDGSGYHEVKSLTIVEEKYFTVPSYTHQGTAVKAWSDSIDSIFLTVGSTAKALRDYNGMQFLMFLGGWHQSSYYPREASSIAEIDGLYQIPFSEATTTINQTITVNGGDVCLFDSSTLVASDPSVGPGELPREAWAFDYSSTAYPGKGDDQIYHLDKGVMQMTTGLVTIDGSYYYFREDHTACRDGYFEITSTDPAVPSGIYHFAADGKMELPSTSDYLPTVVEDGYAYYEIGQNQRVLAKDYGLFALNGYLYYALPDGSVVADTNPASYRTFYVSKLNGCTINGVLVVEGLYYFDSSGRMYDANYVLITTGANAA